MAPTTRPSSSRLRPTLVKGSGEALAAARVLVLAAWLVAARVPPSSAAARPMVALSAPSAPAASAAPAGTRSTLLTRSQIESTQGILSAKNSMKSMKPAAPSSMGCCSTCRPGGSGSQPSQPARPVRNTTRYRRRPLDQPSAAASASSSGVPSWLRVSCMAQRPFTASRPWAAASPARACSGKTPALRGLLRWRACRRCGARSRRAARR